METGMRSPITWYGGKGLLAGSLLRLVPPHTTWVEACAGGAALTFAKPPSAIDVINDVHDGITTLYRVLRDPLTFVAFEKLCQLTPYSRSQFGECRDCWACEADPVRKAWAFFVAVRQSFAGHVSPSVRPTWGYSVADPGGDHVRRWLGSVDGLMAVHARLRHVQVECRPWQDLLPIYDGPDVLWYFDPPYPLSARVGGVRYDHEMTDREHHEMVARLCSLRGMVMLSGYHVPALHRPLDDAGWQRRDFAVAIAAARQRTGMRRVESVWRNPAAVRAWEAHRGPLFAGLDSDGAGAAAR